MTKTQKQAAKILFGDVRSASEPFKYINPNEDVNKDRSKMTRALNYCFLVGLLSILYLTPIYNAIVGAELRLDIYKLLSTFAGILGPIVGALSAYYYKNEGSTTER